MMRLALDTNRYVDLAKGVAEVVTVVSTAAEIVVPFPVIAELRSGFRGGTRRGANESELQRFLKTPGVAVLYPDWITLDLWAAIGAELRPRGRTIPHNDLWIAAICLQHRLPLYSRDRHFNGIRGLEHVKHQD